MSSLRFKIGLAGIALVVSASTALADTLILRGARVLTMDPTKPEAAAVAVVDGKIAAVGSADEMQPFLDGAKIYDLPAESLVLPGFQDSHNHLIWSATAAEDISLTDVADEAGLRAAIEPVLATLPEGAWLRGGGWSVAVYLNPSKEVLDKITGDRPARSERAHV